MLIVSRLYSPLKARVYNMYSLASLPLVCREVKDQPVNLGLISAC